MDLSIDSDSNNFDKDSADRFHMTKQVFKSFFLFSLLFLFLLLSFLTSRSCCDIPSILFSSQTLSTAWKPSQVSDFAVGVLEGDNVRMFSLDLWHSGTRTLFTSF